MRNSSRQESRFSNVFATFTSKTKTQESAPLHCDQTVFYDNFLCEEISANGRLVLVAELLVDILVHQRRLSDAGVAKYDDFEERLLS